MTTNGDIVKPQLSHRGLLAVGAVVAVALVIIVAVGTWMYLDLRKHERELRQLLNPTAQQFRDQLQEGLKRCLHEPQCRKLFPQLVIRKNPKTHNESVVPAPARHPRRVSATGTTPRRPRPTATGSPAALRPRSVRPPRTVPEKHHHHTTPPPSSHSPPPSSPPPPSKPSPPVTLTAPIVPLTLCTPLAQVNQCPSTQTVP